MFASQAFLYSNVNSSIISQKGKEGRDAIFDALLNCISNWLSCCNQNLEPFVVINPIIIKKLHSQPLMGEHCTSFFGRVSTSECYLVFPGDDTTEENEIEQELLSEAETVWAQREWSIQHVLFPSMRLFFKPPTSMATNGTFIRVSLISLRL